MDSRDGDALSRLGSARPTTTRDTSLAAQAAIQHAKSDLQRKVYEYLFTCGDEGATDEEIQLGTGIPGSTERPRRQELQKAGAVVNSGTTRRTLKGRAATIWKLRHRNDDPQSTDSRDDPNRRVAQRRTLQDVWRVHD